MTIPAYSWIYREPVTTLTLRPPFTGSSSNTKRVNCLANSLVFPYWGRRHTLYFNFYFFNAKCFVLIKQSDNILLCFFANPYYSGSWADLIPKLRNQFAEFLYDYSLFWSPSYSTLAYLLQHLGTVLSCIILCAHLFSLLVIKKYTRPWRVGGCIINTLLYILKNVYFCIHSSECILLVYILKNSHILYYFRPTYLIFPAHFY